MAVRWEARERGALSGAMTESGRVVRGIHHGLPGAEVDQEPVAGDHGAGGAVDLSRRRGPPRGTRPAQRRGRAVGCAPSRSWSPRLPREAVQQPGRRRSGMGGTSQSGDGAARGALVLRPRVEAGPVAREVRATVTGGAGARGGGDGAPGRALTGVCPICRGRGSAGDGALRVLGARGLRGRSVLAGFQESSAGAGRGRGAPRSGRAEVEPAALPVRGRVLAPLPLLCPSGAG
jgi:hypothetical protein